MVSIAGFIEYISSKLPSNDAVRCIINLESLLVDMDEKEKTEPITMQTIDIILEKAKLLSDKPGVDKYLLDDAGVFYNYCFEQASFCDNSKKEKRE